MQRDLLALKILKIELYELAVQVRRFCTRYIAQF